MLGVEGVSHSSVPDDPVVFVIGAADPDDGDVAAGVDATAAISASGGRAAVWIGERDDPELAEFKEELRTRPRAGGQLDADPTG